MDGIKRKTATERDREFAAKYPNLAAEQENDRQEHIRAAVEMGATRRQATRHADDEVGAH